MADPVNFICDICLLAIFDDVTPRDNSLDSVLKAISFLSEQEKPIFTNILSKHNPDTISGLDVILNALGEVCKDKTSWGRILVLMSFASYAASEASLRSKEEIYFSLREALLVNCRWINRHGGPKAFIAFCERFIRNHSSRTWNFISNFVRSSFTLATSATQNWVFLQRI